MRKLDEGKDRDVIDSWYGQAEATQTPGGVATFLQSLIQDYQHDYGTIVHAIAAAMMAAMHVMDRSKQGGITGFQAGCLASILLQRMQGEEYSIFNDIQWLYPQYREQCTTISEGRFEWIQKKAREFLAEDDKAPFDVRANDAVRAHWQRIADGEPPFGVQVRKS